jgi:hypothetical protein
LDEVTRTREARSKLSAEVDELERQMEEAVRSLGHNASRTSSAATA